MNRVHQLVAMCSLTAMVAVGCGIGDQSNAHVFPIDEVPAGILDGQATTTTIGGSTTTTTATLASPVKYRLFFKRDGLLEEVNRSASDELELDKIPAQLAGGLTPTERSKGYRTAIERSSMINRIRLTGTMAEVDLNTDFGQIPRGDQVFAIGQITLTLTDRPEINWVRFTMLNTSILVPRGDLVQTDSALQADDFKELLRGLEDPFGESGPTGGSGASGESGPTGEAGEAAADGATGSPGASTTVVP